MNFIGATRILMTQCHIIKHLACAYFNLKIHYDTEEWHRFYLLLEKVVDPKNEKTLESFLSEYHYTILDYIQFVANKFFQIIYTNARFKVDAYVHDAFIKYLEIDISTLSKEDIYKKVRTFQHMLIFILDLNSLEFRNAWPNFTKCLNSYAILIFIAYAYIFNGRFKPDYEEVIKLKWLEVENYLMEFENIVNYLTSISIIIEEKLNMELNLIR